MTHLNDYGQAIGELVPAWSPRPLPPRAPLHGRYCHLESINAKRHGAELFDAYATAPDERAWTYLFAQPFAQREAFQAYLEQSETSLDPLLFAVVDNTTGRAVGYLSLMRMDPANGVMEVGNINFSPLLQRTPAASEALCLLMTLAFSTLGYRRFEWKCDSLNLPSRQAALRYGFTFEGIFRQAVIYKGRTRDTAWFSIIDGEWPAVKSALETWLSPDNFEPDGNQRNSLAEIRRRLESGMPA